MNSNNRRLKRQIRDQSICVSNATNSRSPNDLRSRIFIGNLNTSVITKRHLHLIFVPFGDIKAISMHKGYAFIQYDDQMDAINAVLAQDQQMIAGQAIDVNLVTEPKPHQKSSKSSTVSNGSETSGELIAETETNSMENSVESDVNYTKFENTLNEMIGESDQRLHSEETLNEELSEENPLNHHLSEVQTKRVKLDINPEVISETTIDISSQKCKNCENSLQSCGDESSRRSDNMTSDADDYTNKHLINTSDNCSHYLNEQNHSSFATLLSNPSLNSLLSNNNLNNNNNNQRLNQDSIGLTLSQVQQQSYDILICGNCRTFFTSLSLFIQHKRSSKCRLRFVCHCQQK